MHVYSRWNVTKNCLSLRNAVNVFSNSNTCIVADEALYINNESAHHIYLSVNLSDILCSHFSEISKIDFRWHIGILSFIRKYRSEICQQSANLHVSGTPNFSTISHRKYEFNSDWFFTNCFICHIAIDVVTN